MHLQIKEGSEMDEKVRKDVSEEPCGRINQFIIECMFSKYFEEERNDKMVNKREKMKV